MTDDTYYELLGVEPDASRDDLRSAYRSRVESLEASREGKGVTDSSLQANREETARVRTAWNVLSDPFQRQRYDAQLAGPADGDVDGDADGGAGDEPGTEVELTGWRKLLAPPPPKQPRNGTAASGGNGKAPPPGRPVPQPTIPLPPGVTFADGKARGMALMFDISILLLMFLAISLVLPGVIQSDYKKITDKISHQQDLEDKANDRADTAGDRASTATDKAKAADKKGDTVTADEQREVAQTQKQKEKDQEKIAKAANKKQEDLAKDVAGTKIIVNVIALVVMLLYLVPATALTGRTLGMRRTRIKVLRVDGTPVGWLGSFARYIVPLAVALFIPQLGPVLGLGLVLWGYRDRNKQGIHDKLAKTIVVNGQV